MQDGVSAARLYAYPQLAGRLARSGRGRHRRAISRHFRRRPARISDASSKRRRAYAWSGGTGSTMWQALSGTLYEKTRQRSGVHYGDFEALPQIISAPWRQLRAGERAQFCLYWIGDELAAFNLLLLGRGHRHRQISRHALSAGAVTQSLHVSWIENVRFCLETGRRGCNRDRPPTAPSCGLAAA